MMNYLTFGPVNSNEFGVHISGGGTYNAPKRNVTTEAVPGRNGNISFDNGNFENITVSYPAFIINDLPDKVRDFRNKLCSLVGYQRLEDTYDLDTFRLGIYKSGLDVKTSGYGNRHGEFNIDFDCKPQRFLKVGEKVIEFLAAGELFNPTECAAKPFLRIHGSGNAALSLGDYIITLTGIDSYIDVDCELMDAYKGVANLNSKVSFNADEVDLLPGVNGISWTGGITKVEITPRWWRL